MFDQAENEGSKAGFLPYSETVNYWKTSASSSDTWMDRTKKLIRKFGGEILAEGFGSNAAGDAAFMLGFKIAGDTFRIVWPVLPSKTHNVRAARIQAVTMLFRDVKAKIISAAVLGARTSFFSYLLLPNGQTASEAAAPELMRVISDLSATPRLTGTTDGDG